MKRITHIIACLLFTSQAFAQIQMPAPSPTFELKRNRWAYRSKSCLL